MKYWCKQNYWRILLIVIWCCIPGYLLRAQNNSAVKTNLSDFLQDYLNFSALPAYQSNSYCAQTSSYDTTGGNDDGFSGKYSFLYRNADSSLTIFEQHGPGVIQRIWTPTPSDDSLAFYIDDSIQPAFIIKYRDLFSGKVFPFIAPLCNNQLGGYYCYLPIPFKQYCKIIYKGKKTQFHQIQYRLFSSNDQIMSFKLPLNTEEKNLLNQIPTSWSKPAYENYKVTTNPILNKKQTITLQPGQTTNVFNLNQGGRILGIELSPAQAFEGLEKNVDLKITWDQELQPAVYCPVPDFFGYAFGKASMNSLLIGSDGSKNFCYYPMPFDRSAKIELIYRKQNGKNNKPLNIDVKIIYQNLARNPGLEGKFYAFRSSTNTTPGQPHVFINTSGKGHLVGTQVQAQGLKPGMTLFFEGDDSTAVDGQSRMHGTGSEDFFNGGWYALLDRWDGPFSLPLSGALDYSLPFCRTGGYRLFLGDKISFEKSIYQSMEHGPTGNSFPGIYTSVAYYYSDRPPVSIQTPNDQNSKVYLPDTLILYPQILQFSLEGDIHTATKWAYPTGGETYYFTVSPNSLLRTSLQEIPSGDYELSLDYIAGPESCSFSIWQRQTQLTDWIAGAAESVKRIENQKITSIHIDHLSPSITFQFKTEPGKNKLILNRLILVRKAR